MPISREAFDAAARHEEVTGTIRTFLEAHRDQAYSEVEVLEALASGTGVAAPAVGLHYAVQEALKDLVRAGAIQHRKIGGTDYYSAERRGP